MRKVRGNSISSLRSKGAQGRESHIFGLPKAEVSG
jgi:hypothetical protein